MLPKLRSPQVRRVSAVEGEVEPDRRTQLRIRQWGQREAGWPTGIRGMTVTKWKELFNVVLCERDFPCMKSRNLGWENVLVNQGRRKPHDMVSSWKRELLFMISRQSWKNLGLGDRVRGRKVCGGCPKSSCMEGRCVYTDVLVNCWHCVMWPFSTNYQ
jgi:hypothetical protein